MATLDEEVAIEPYKQFDGHVESRRYRPNRDLRSYPTNGDWRRVVRQQIA